MKLLSEEFHHDVIAVAVVVTCTAVGTGTGKSSTAAAPNRRNGQRGIPEARNPWLEASFAGCSCLCSCFCFPVKKHWRNKKRGENKKKNTKETTRGIVVFFTAVVIKTGFGYGYSHFVRRFIDGAGGHGAGEKQLLLKSKLAPNGPQDWSPEEFGTAK